MTSSPDFAPQMPPMPAASLPALESQPEARLLELNAIHRTRPNLPTAMARAEAGERIDRLLEEMVEFQQEIDAGSAA